jgi:hypothetical protein
MTISFPLRARFAVALPLAMVATEMASARRARLCLLPLFHQDHSRHFAQLTFIQSNCFPER